MAYSYVVYTGNGATTQYAIPFQYIKKEHVKVFVNFVDTAYTYVNNTTVLLASAPANGARVEVRRFTPANTPLVDFVDGSTLVASDLDTSNLQHLFLEQELDDSLKQTVSINAATGLPSAGNQRITNVSAPVAASDAATKTYVDGLIAAATLADADYGDITVSSNAAVWSIDNNAVTTAKLNSAAGAEAVTSAVIRSGAVTTAKLDATANTQAVTTAVVRDGAITTAKLDSTAALQAVTTSVIRDAAITAEKINGGAVTTAKLDSTAGAQAVTTGVVRDGAITTAKLDSTAGAQAVTTAVVRDGAITTAKLDSTAGAQAVTTAVIRDSAVTVAKLAFPIIATSAYKTHFWNGFTNSTFLDFENIFTSATKRITVIFHGLSTNGTASYLVQLGLTVAGTPSYYTSGYTSTSVNVASTAGFVVASASAGNAASGHMVITKAGINVGLGGQDAWVASLACKMSTGASIHGGGDIFIDTNALTSLRVTTTSGTPIFDAGAVSVMYE